MKILIVSSFLPYPLFSGGHVRLFNIIKELAVNNELTLVCEIRNNQGKDDIKYLEKYCKKVIVFGRKKQWSLQTILYTGFSWYPFLLSGHRLPSMQEEITALLETETFDVIHVETFYVMQNLPKTTTPIVLIEHNIEYLVYSRYVSKSSFFLKPILSLDIIKLKFWEEYFWRKATKLVAVSEKEKQLMNRDDVEVVPNGVDTQKFKVQSSKFKTEKREKIILFIGDFKWIQNRDAVEWILKEILPSFVRLWRTSAGKPKVKLWIVGRKIPDSIRKLTNDENIIFDENAPIETEKIFEAADILLAPIRVGGGTSYKILEAMASGVPVVTTPLGMEGIDANNKEVVIAGTAENIADEVVSLLENSEKYQMIAKNARVLIEEKYDWKKIVKKLESVYGLAVGGKHD